MSNQINRIIVTLLLFISAVATSIEAKIIETDRFSDLLNEADCSTLVLIDIDETMVHTTTMLGSTPWWIYFTAKGAKAGFDIENLPKNINDLIEKIIVTVPLKTIENNTADTIKTLQDKGIIVLGLTARHIDPNFFKGAGIRISQDLDKLQINFSNAKLSKKPTSAFYLNGIMFADHQLKGPFLAKFLNEMEMKFTKVVFIDDSEKQLLSLQKTLDELHIPFVGLHYNYVKNNHLHFDPLIANVQLQYLIENNCLLSNSEAKEIAAKKGLENPDYYVDQLIKTWAQEKEAVLVPQ